MTLRIALVALALTSLIGCPETATTDAGLDAAATLDAPVLNDSFVLVPDAATTEDAHVAVEDAPAQDAFTAASDAAATSDAPVSQDARAALPGMCNREACTPTCLRPVRCVTECGGPEAECGCCACAAGSIDSISCSSSM